MKKTVLTFGLLSGAVSAAMMFATVPFIGFMASCAWPRGPAFSFGAYTPNIGLPCIQRSMTALWCAFCADSAGVEQMRAAMSHFFMRPPGRTDYGLFQDLAVLEIRDQIKAGKTTALILTGGMEENGPSLTRGKHNGIALAPAAKTIENGKKIVASDFSTFRFR